MEEFSTREIAAIKRQFKNSLPLLRKIEAIDRKIEILNQERGILKSDLDAGETGILHMTGGYRSYDLIECQYVPQFNEDGTPKMDKEGKYQVRNQVLTFHMPVEVPAVEGNMESDYDVDSEVKVDETETSASDAAYNPLNIIE